MVAGVGCVVEEVDADGCRADVGELLGGELADELPGDVGEAVGGGGGGAVVDDAVCGVVVGGVHGDDVVLCVLGFEDGECVGGLACGFPFAEFEGAAVFVVEFLAAKSFQAFAHAVQGGFAAGDGLQPVVGVGDFDDFGEFEGLAAGFGWDQVGGDVGEQALDGAADEVAAGAAVAPLGKRVAKAVVYHDAAHDGGVGFKGGFGVRRDKLRAAGVCPVAYHGVHEAQQIRAPGGGGQAFFVQRGGELALGGCGGEEQVADEGSALYVGGGADVVAGGKDLHFVAGGEHVQPAEFAAFHFVGGGDHVDGAGGEDRHVVQDVEGAAADEGGLQGFDGVVFVFAVGGAGGHAPGGGEAEPGEQRFAAAGLVGVEEADGHDVVDEQAAVLAEHECHAAAGAAVAGGLGAGLDGAVRQFPADFVFLVALRSPGEGVHELIPGGAAGAGAVLTATGGVVQGFGDVGHGRGVVADGGQLDGARAVGCGGAPDGQADGDDGFQLVHGAPPGV